MEAYGVGVRRRRRRRGELMAKKLLLSNYTVAAGSTAGTVVGAVTNKIASSTLTLIDDAGGRFALSGLDLVVGSVVPTAGKYLINLKEQNSMALEITQIEITVT